MINTNPLEQLILDQWQTENISYNSLFVAEDRSGNWILKAPAQKVYSLWDGILEYKEMNNRISLEEGASKEYILLDSLESPGICQGAVIPIPKSKAYFEYLLALVSPQLEMGSVVMAPVLDRYWNPYQFKLLEKYIGPAFPSKGKKKGRILFAEKTIENSPPNPFPLSYEESHLKQSLWEQAKGFSLGKLDGGSRLMLEAMDSIPGAAYVADLASGNGILGIAYHKKHPDSSIDFYDFSRHAVWASDINAREAGIENFHVFWEDCLGEIQNRYDLILNNPPFHQGHGVEGETSIRMFRQAYNALKPGGRLWVVGNRHLGYHRRLQEIFSNHRIRRKDKRFLVIEAVKRS